MVALWIAAFVVAGLLISAYLDKIIAWGKKVIEAIISTVRHAKVVLKRIGERVFRAFVIIINGEGRPVKLSPPDQPIDHYIDVEEILDLLENRPDFLLTYYPKFKDMPFDFQDALLQQNRPKVESIWPDAKVISYVNPFQLPHNVRQHFEEQVEHDIIIYK